MRDANNTTMGMNTSTSEIEAGCDSGCAIRVMGVSKYFSIYDTPRDRLKQMVMPRLHRLFGRAPRSYHREFWALNAVSFEIRRGETVGIIGRNGAGKSTLLQIICGTLEPSDGEVMTHGRIAALLELGAGFNPEFTGRENVFMNGAILGFSREEMAQRFDEIAAFADIGEFIDQPVKTYSSGMYVRLAFAVQACVDPEILIVDEALAVGDIGFQYKCFKRMEALKKKGVTILMVTHATGSILEYADRCIVLDGGRVIKDTPDVLAAVLAYEKGMLNQAQAQALRIEPVTAAGADARPMTVGELKAIQQRDWNQGLGEKRFGSARAIIERLDLYKGDGASLEENPLLKPNEEVVFRFKLLAAETIQNVALGVSISGVRGGDIWGDNNLSANQPLNLEPGTREVEYRVRLPISSGEYLVHCGLACFSGEGREELDQRRPVGHLRFWSPRDQVGVVHAPIRISMPGALDE
jgi:lipopolysaccharide transport system ATP-binding protein